MEKNKHSCSADGLRKELETMNELQEDMDIYMKYLEARVIELEDQHGLLEGRVHQLEKQIELLQALVLGNVDT